MPWRGGDRVTLQMGASRGRLTYLSLVRDGSATTAPLETLTPERQDLVQWIFYLIYGLVPIVASVVFGIRNLRLGRGDTRNATRIAVFVAIMNLLAALFATRLSEVGLLGLAVDLTVSRALGHALLHAVGMWFGYVALEPYVRRLWPTMLVSWTRLVSGRVRDPLVGRDVLIGGAIGSALSALATLAVPVTAKLGLAKSAAQLDTSMLTALTGLSYTSCQIAYAASVCVLDTFGALVVVLLLRLLLRNTAAAVAITFLLTAAIFSIITAPDVGWVIAISSSIIGSLTILVLMRFGLLAAVVSMFVVLMMATVVGSLDLSSWYADRTLIPMMLLVGLMLFGAINALGGHPIFSDPIGAGER